MFTWLRRNGSFSRAHNTPGITSTTWSWPGWFSQGYRSASAEDWMASVLLCILNAYRDLRRYASRKSRESPMLPAWQGWCDDFAGAVGFHTGGGRFRRAG